MTRIGRGVSPHPDTTQESGIIPDIRSLHGAIAKHPDREQSPEELLFRKIRGLIRAVRHGFYLETIDSFTLKDKGWRISLETETDGNQVLFGYFDNEPGQIPTTIQATYSLTHRSDTHVTYNGPDGAYEGDAAFVPIVKTIKPHFTRIS
jgi:hypothetical protein